MNAKLAFVALATAALAVGCGSRSSSSKALDIVDPYSPAPANTQTAAQPTTPAPQPVAQPVVYDSQPTNQLASAQPMTATGGNTYQVKRGDTLFSIAKGRYGSGNQWQKIASANPGLTPQNLKAGQMINIP